MSLMMTTGSVVMFEFLVIVAVAVVGEDDEEFLAVSLNLQYEYFVCLSWFVIPYSQKSTALYIENPIIVNDQN